MTALALGAQSAALEVALIVLFPIVLFQAAEGSDAVAAWAVLAMLTANGATTILQAFRAGPLGSGLFVINYPSPTSHTVLHHRAGRGRSRDVSSANPGVRSLSVHNFPGALPAEATCHASVQRGDPDDARNLATQPPQAIRERRTHQTGRGRQ